MNSYAIARIFTRIGDLMEIQGENAFKIRAYRSAASTMQELTESLDVLAERGELRSIPGIGDAIAAKTRDILATGTCDLYERLKAQVPESLTELLGLPGFGPKKIRTVWEALSVRSLDDLEQAAKDQRLRTVPGLGAKSEETILESIGALRRRRERIPIGVALPYAQALVRMLEATGAFTRLEVVGSVRRRKDLVSDIDLLGSAADIGGALDAFANHSEIIRVLERSPDRVAACGQSGVRVELAVVTDGEWGTALVQSTGSAEHVAALGALHAAAEEDQVYQSLGLPAIPVELREGRGEIEAAKAGRLPKLIEARDVQGILHAHSTWSDGSASIAQMAETARKLGYSYHGNTDHSHALSVTGGLDEARLREQMAEINALNASFAAEGSSFRVLRGIECDVLQDGSLDLAIEILSELDFVIASVHMHQRMDEATMTARIVRALESGVVDLLAHPTGRILGMRDPYPVDMERVIDAALANGVALEINAYPDRLDLHEVHARRAQEQGVLISLNTDAHRPDHLALLSYGISQARRAWLEAEDVINCWPLDRLMRWLQTRAR